MGILSLLFTGSMVITLYDKSTSVKVNFNIAIIKSLNTTLIGGQYHFYLKSYKTWKCEDHSHRFSKMCMCIMIFCLFYIDVLTLDI